MDEHNEGYSKWIWIDSREVATSISRKNKKERYNCFSCYTSLAFHQHILGHLWGFVLTEMTHLSKYATRVAKKKKRKIIPWTSGVRNSIRNSDSVCWMPDDVISCQIYPCVPVHVNSLSFLYIREVLNVVHSVDQLWTKANVTYIHQIDKTHTTT